MVMLIKKRSVTMKGFCQQWPALQAKMFESQHVKKVSSAGPARLEIGHAVRLLKLPLSGKSRQFLKLDKGFA